MSAGWTVLKLLRWATDYFAEKGIDSPRLDAELLLAHVLELDRVGIYLNYDRPLQEAELNQLRPLVKRRGQREPLQYICGDTEFWSVPFKVSPGVLIPRPETEILVEEALARSGSKGRLLDVGCGSGAIVISLAKELPEWRLEALDISAEAVALTEENACLNGVGERLVIYAGDLAALPPHCYDLIVSNPPYIAEEEWDELMPEVRCHEPRQALLAGDGLAAYRQLAGQIGEHLTPGGWLLVEIGCRQGDAVQQLFRAAGLKDVYMRRDYAGQPRVVGGRLPDCRK